MKSLSTNCRRAHFWNCSLSSSLYWNVPLILGLISRCIVTVSLLSLPGVIEGDKTA